MVAVSPIVGGQVLKGPTAAFMAWAGLPLGAAGVARAYAEVADVVVADEDQGVAGLPVVRTDTRMDDPERRRRVAEIVLGAAMMGEA